MIDPIVPQSALIRFFQDHWLTIVFGLLGAIGTIYGFLNSRKQKRAYGYLFKLAELNIDKNVTEETLAARRQEVQAASERIEALQRQIRNDIPKEARRAVLRDRLESETAMLHQHYKTVRHLADDLEALGMPVEFPRQVLEAIQQQIRPEYVLREKRSSLKTYLTIVTASAGVTSTILPYPLSRLASIPLLLVALSILLALTKVSLPSGPDARRTIVNAIVRWGSTAFGVLFLGLSVFIFAVSLSAVDSEMSMLGVAALLFMLGVALLAFSALRWRAIWRTRRAQANGRRPV